MKKNIILGMGILLIFSQFLFSQTYYINKETENFNPFGWQETVTLNKNYKIQSDEVFDIIAYRPEVDTYVVDVLIDYNGMDIGVLSDDFSLKNSDTFDENIKSKYWIPAYYFDVIRSNSIQSSLLEKESFWKKWRAIDEWETTWVNAFTLSSVILSDTNLYNPMLEHLGGAYVLFSSLKLKKNYYEATINKVSEDIEQPLFSKFYDIKENSKITLVFDGDYLTINLDGVEVIKLVGCDVQTRDEIKESIKYDKCNFSKITWPRHADGTCDYEDVSSVKSVSTSTTNVSPNKTMTVSENLKLRSGEATSTQVLTVMSAGTKVKILELGKAENIDGINSNWVKVEVQSDAKDRDGRTIRAGTVGWCYGGYLK